MSAAETLSLHSNGTDLSWDRPPDNAVIQQATSVTAYRSTRDPRDHPPGSLPLHEIHSRWYGADLSLLLAQSHAQSSHRGARHHLAPSPQSAHLDDSTPILCLMRRYPVCPAGSWEGHATHLHPLWNDRDRDHS